MNFKKKEKVVIFDDCKDSEEINFDALENDSKRFSFLNGNRRESQNLTEIFAKKESLKELLRITN